MLTFLITREWCAIVETYLDVWAPELREYVRTIGYEDLPASGQLEPGTYIFCDQERWSCRQRRLAVSLWDQLKSAGPAMHLLNDPRRLLLRYQLLKKLHQSGKNNFDVYHVWEAFGRTRFPVFLHSYGGHEGPLSPLLRSKSGLLFAIVSKFIETPRTRVMVEEFCDVSVDGIYSKYGAFNLGGVVLPRHLFFGKEWAQKGDETTLEIHLDQMEAYLVDNPHAVEIGKIFADASIDFGRIDYAFYENKMQVWEINTNPLIIGSIPAGTPPREIEMARRFNNLIKPEFVRLASLSVGGNAVPYRLGSRF